MIRCLVTETLTAQIKMAGLAGKKLLVCRPAEKPENVIVAVDTLGAGIGSEVLVSKNYSTRQEEYGVDCMVSAILDPK